MTNEDISKLKGLMDPKNAILERQRDTAPGTFKHSKNVASFCESVALELNIPSEELLVAATYHDIGKIICPEVFSENQNDENIHDKLEPIISYNFISRHVGDSIMLMLQIKDMPKKIMEIVSQHHGNTVMKFFFDKSGQSLDDLYRYKCLPPQSLEAAILMLCDSVEATARSVFMAGGLKTKEDRTSVVDNTVQRLMKDDQLDNIMVGELKVIRRVLMKELDSTYHNRETYGDETKKVGDDDISIKDLE
jgi:cyclic-di-AMP phosphodiesterase PgpH